MARAPGLRLVRRPSSAASCMDLAEDVSDRARLSAIARRCRRRVQLRHLARRRRRRLLQRRALQLRRHHHQQVVYNDKLVSTVAGLGILGRVGSRFLLEMAVGCNFVRGAAASTRRASSGVSSTCACSWSSCATCRRRARSSTSCAACRFDYLGYDEYAHRHGDAELALYNLIGTIAPSARSSACRGGAEYNRDVYVISDPAARHHAVRVRRRQDFASYVLEHARARVADRLESHDVAQLVSLRATEFWTHPAEGLRGRRGSTSSGCAAVCVAAPMSTRAPGRRARGGVGRIDRPLYADRGSPARPTRADRRALSRLMAALEHCPAVGLMVARRRRADGSIAGGTIAWRSARAEALRALRHARLRALAAPPARRGARHGDLVLYGASPPPATSPSTSSSARGSMAPMSSISSSSTPARPAAASRRGRRRQFYPFFSELRSGPGARARDAA